MKAWKFHFVTQWSRNARSVC